MQKNIYFIGTYVQGSGVGIYAEKLISTINTLGYYTVHDHTVIAPATDFRKKVKNFFQTLQWYFSHTFTSQDIIIEVNTMTLIPYFLFGKRVPHIHIIHDLFFYEKDAYSAFPQRKASLFCFYLTIFHKYISKRIYLSKSSTLVAISPATKQEILAQFGEKIANKTNIIYNGIDLHTFYPHPSQHPKQNAYILYIGAEIERKNLKNMLAAFVLIKKQFPDVIFIKASLASKEQRKITLSYIQDTGLVVGKDIIFIDEYLSTEKIVELYSDAELFLFPSLKEGFGFPIIEAQACATPVITSNYSPMIDLVPYKKMTVNPTSPQDIAEKTIQILKDKTLRSTLTIEGLSYVQQFSWENTVKQFDILIQKIIEIR